MEIEDIGVFAEFPETIARLNDPGALLVAGVSNPNVMTIGWGMPGIIWGLPIFMIFVRPSRFTHHLLEEHQEFTINIPTRDMAAEVMICGTKSGRDLDKFAECGFTLAPGHKVEVPHIVQCPIHYECRTVHKNTVIADKLKRKIRSTYYGSGDLHDVYYGEILGVYKNQP
jgi:flavin reductase (DIM6/NTAB) family NADH-FMN oxidoreductase RutF